MFRVEGDYLNSTRNCQDENVKGHNMWSDQSHNVPKKQSQNQRM